MISILIALSAAPLVEMRGTVVTQRQVRPTFPTLGRPSVIVAPGVRGPKGDPGPPGPKGDKGPAGTINTRQLLMLVRREIESSFRPVLIVGPDGEVVARSRIDKDAIRIPVRRWP